jgi:PRTRC genetic system protein C
LFEERVNQDLESKNLYPSERNRSALAVYVVNRVDLCHGFFQECQQLRQPTTETMSSLKVETLHREFFYNGTRIPDPAPGMSVEQVRELLTPSFPEIATATLEGPEDTGTALRYSFRRAIGSKG